MVVTGLGIVGPLGIGWEETWRAALAGRRGPGRSPASTPRASPAASPARRGLRARGHRPARPAAHGPVQPDGGRRLRLALDDARLEIDGDGYGAGVVIATGNGGSETFEEHHRSLLERGADRSSPLMVPVMIVNMAAGQVSMQLGLRGPATSVVTACASGNHGIGDAAAVIRRGAADVMLAGGSEAGVTPFCMAGLDATRALSRRNDEPERASRPYDVGRDGFVAAEGAGVLVLESLEHARARGAEIVCEVRGYGASSDAYHLTDPEPSGRWQLAAMRQALAEGGLAAEEVDYVNAHGTSTATGDPVEVSAIRQLVGDELAAQVRVSSTKSMHGHAMGAAGGFEAVLTALAIREGRSRRRSTSTSSTQTAPAWTTSPTRPAGAPSASRSPTRSASAATTRCSRSRRWRTGERLERPPRLARVAVTGIGVVSPVGIGREEMWRSVSEGRSGAGLITLFIASDSRVRMACEAPGFEPSDFMERRTARRMDRYAQFAVAAARMAVADAGLSIDRDGEGIGAIIANGGSGATSREEQHALLLERGADRVSPFAIPLSVANMGAGQVSMELGLHGPVTAVCNACAAGTDAIGTAVDVLRRGPPA